MAEDQDSKINAARRRLLKIAIYTPPIVLGAVALNSASGCQAMSNCAPFTNTCGPNNCHPVVNPCAPATCNPATCNPRT